ncbi:IS66 family transposase [Enterococcus faecium]|uniref:IS66 family transposase n=1 Tax=Enterococcus faecium TaxID=1352 RepID=UPI00237A148E|nr:transposase [Enterococcus faecium]
MFRACSAEIFRSNSKRKEKHGYSAAQAVKQLDKWFVLEKKWKDFSPEKRLSCRQQELRPLFIAFYEWMATIDPVAKSKLDAAVQYACKLRSGFELFLKMVV